MIFTAAVPSYTSFWLLVSDISPGSDPAGLYSTEPDYLISRANQQPKRGVAGNCRSEDHSPMRGSAILWIKSAKLSNSGEHSQDSHKYYLHSQNKPLVKSNYLKRRLISPAKSDDSEGKGVSPIWAKSGYFTMKTFGGPKRISASQKSSLTVTNSKQQ